MRIEWRYKREGQRWKRGHKFDISQEEVLEFFENLLGLGDLREFEISLAE